MYGVTDIDKLVSQEGRFNRTLWVQINLDISGQLRILWPVRVWYFHQDNCSCKDYGFSHLEHRIRRKCELNSKVLNYHGLRANYRNRKNFWANLKVSIACMISVIMGASVLCRCLPNSPSFLAMAKIILQLKINPRCPQEDHSSPLLSGWLTAGRKYVDYTTIKIAIRAVSARMKKYISLFELLVLDFPRSSHSYCSWTGE